MGVYAVREPFSFDLPNGVPVIMRRGALVNDDDPAFQGREHLFEPAEEVADRQTPPPVERATAAPGELRTVSTSPKARTQGKKE